MRRAVSPLLPLGLFVLSASVGIVFALLAELQDEHGFGNVTLGAIAAASFFAAVGAQLLLAPLADRGHARHLMVGALVLAAVAALGFALATEPWHFVIARILGGAAFGAYAPAAQAVVTLADPRRAGERLGQLTGLQTAGVIVGPGVGALLVGVGGTDTPFLLFAVVLFVLAPALARVEIREVEVAATAPPTPLPAILRRREALAAVLLSIALILPAGMYEAIWSRFMSDLGASTQFVGLSLSLYGIPFALTAPLGGRLADRLGPLRVAPVALVLVVPLTVAYGHMTTPGLLMGLAMIEAVANGVGLPAAQALMSRATDETERATGQGAAAAAGQIGAGFAALLAAPLYGAQGPEVMFAVTAALILVFGVAAISVGGRAAPARPHTPHGSGSPGDGRSRDPSPA